MTTSHTTGPQLPGSRPALVVSALARTVLGALVLLVLVTVVPAVAGWQSTVVMSGSMAPSVQPGDVTVVRPVDVADLAPGQVLLVDDPAVPQGMLLHRLVQVTDGGLRLKGDANPTVDGALVAPAAVHGVGTLRLPGLGLPVLWASEGRWLPLSGAALALAALVGLSLLHRSPDDEPDHGRTGGSSGHDRPGTRRSRRHVRTALRGGTAALAVAVLVPGTAVAAFSGTTTSTGAVAAARYFTCAGPAAEVAAQYLAMQETGGRTAVNDGTFRPDGTYSGTGVTYRASGPPCDRADRAVTLNGSSGFVYTSIRVSNPSPFSTQLWFRTTTARGGYLVGFGNGPNGDTSSSKDRLVYMTDDGRLTFGVYDGAVRTISSSRAYNDGAWHMVTATFSRSTGATLYVDGVQVAADSTLTSAEPVSGLFRAGYDSLAGWPNAPTSNFFAGSIAHLGVFVTALSAGEVSRQYAAFR